ncbi:DUF4468 domain-containing protein [Algoriphagus namhaensis]|uniref:DUF4468 domain-containing protein n=1 Tax=Algoriphagus namhaensis TaxID=915353 RepID=A0ABV8AWL3_9BACT
MKQLTLFTVLLLFSFLSYGQKVADTYPFDMQSIPESIQIIDGFMGIQQIIEAEDQSQDELYQLLSRWIAQNYKRGDYVTDLDSKTSIIVKGNNTMMVEYVQFSKSSGMSKVSEKITNDHTITFDIKDSRIRVTVIPNDMKLYFMNFNPNTFAQYEDYVEGNAQVFYNNALAFDPFTKYKRKELKSYNFSFAYLQAFDRWVQSKLISIEKAITNKPNDDW